MNVWDFLNNRDLGGKSKTTTSTHDLVLQGLGVTTPGLKAKVISKSNILVLRNQSKYAQALAKIEGDKQHQEREKQDRIRQTFKDEEYMAKVDQRHAKNMNQINFSDRLADDLLTKLVHISKFKDFIPRNTRNLIKTQIINFLNESQGQNTIVSGSFTKGLELEWSIVDLDYVFNSSKNIFEPRFKPQISSNTLNMINQLFTRISNETSGVDKKWRYTSNVTYTNESMDNLPASTKNKMSSLPSSFLPENYEFRKVYVKEEGGKREGDISYQLKSKIMTNDDSSELFGMRFNSSHEIDLPIPKGQINKIDKKFVKKYERSKDSYVYTIYSSGERTGERFGERAGERHALWEIEVSTITVTLHKTNSKPTTFVTRGVEVEYVGDLQRLVTRGVIDKPSSEGDIAGSFRVGGSRYSILKSGVLVSSTPSADDTDDMDVVGFFNSSPDPTQRPHTVFPDFNYVQDMVNAMNRDPESYTQAQVDEIARLVSLRDDISASLSFSQKDRFRSLKRTAGYKSLLEGINLYLEGGSDFTIMECIIGLLSFCKNTGFVRTLDFPLLNSRGGFVDMFKLYDYTFCKNKIMSLYKDKKIPLELERGYIAFEFNRLTYYTHTIFTGPGSAGKKVVFKKKKNDILGRTWNTSMRNIQVSDNLDSSISTEVTLKLDGVRALFMMCEFGNYILIPPMGIYKVSGNTINKGVGTTILDGEFYYPKSEGSLSNIPTDFMQSVGVMPLQPTFTTESSSQVIAIDDLEEGLFDDSDEEEEDANSKETIPMSHLKGFYAFDIMVSRGENIMKRGFSISTSRKIKPRKVELYDFVESVQGGVSTTSLEFELASSSKLNFMCLGGDEFNIFSKRFFMSRKEGLDAYNNIAQHTTDGIGYDLDGLVLQNRGGYHEQSLKWKPPEMMTIDFEIGEVVSDNVYQALTAGGKPFKFDNLPVVISEGINSFFSEGENVKGKIVECLYTPDPQIRGSGAESVHNFKILRVRYDKPHANSYNTAIRTFKDIMSPISVRTLLNSDNTASRKYQNLLKEIVLKNCISFIYQNWNTPFSSEEGDGSVSIDDIGSGNGGDIGKWNKFSRYISEIKAYEPNPENREEFEKRLSSKFNSEISNLTEIIPENYEDDVSKIHPPLGGSTKLVTSFYSLTLMFGPDESPLERLFEKMDGYEDGTMFATIFMDGDLYNGKVKNRKFECVNDIDGQTNFEIRYPKYMSHNSEKFGPGRKVEVKYESSQSFIGSSSGFQSEFATSGRYLENLASSRGYQTIYNSSVNPRSLAAGEYGFMDEKSAAELSIKFNMLNKCGREWASIHRILVFVKRGDGEQVPLLRERRTMTRKPLDLSRRTRTTIRRSSKGDGDGVKGGGLKKLDVKGKGKEEEDDDFDFDDEDWDDMFNDLEHDEDGEDEKDNEDDDIEVYIVTKDSEGDYMFDEESISDVIVSLLQEQGIEYEDLGTGKDLVDVVGKEMEFRDESGNIIQPQDVFMN